LDITSWNDQFPEGDDLATMVYATDGNYGRHGMSYIGGTWFGFKARLEVIDNGDLFEIAQVGYNGKCQIGEREHFVVL
jgi:hypothetical protein